MRMSQKYNIIILYVCASSAEELHWNEFESVGQLDVDVSKSPETARSLTNNICHPTSFCRRQTCLPAIQTCKWERSREGVR